MNGYMRHVYAHVGLHEDATEEEVKSKARELLKEMETNFYGAELILGRRIDASEFEVVKLFGLAPLMSNVDVVIMALLLQKSLEQQQEGTEA